MLLTLGTGIKAASLLLDSFLLFNSCSISIYADARVLALISVHADANMAFTAPCCIQLRFPLHANLVLLCLPSPGRPLSFLGTKTPMLQEGFLADVMATLCSFSWRLCVSPSLRMPSHIMLLLCSGAQHKISIWSVFAESRNEMKYPYLNQTLTQEIFFCLHLNLCK